MAGDNHSPNDIFEDQTSRLKDGLKSCHNVVANYRAMLKDGSNDDLLDAVANEGSKSAELVS